jgi:putative flippase GtrA
MTARVVALPRRLAQARRRVRPRHVAELAMFCAVGSSGYVVNLAVFSFLVTVVGVGHLLAAAASFMVAVTNNFALNRHFTFRHSRRGRARMHARRFLLVSFAIFLPGAGMLALLVDGLGAPPVPAQALSIAVATPLSFVAHRMFSFRDDSRLPGLHRSFAWLK